MQRCCWPFVLLASCAAHPPGGPPLGAWIRESVDAKDLSQWKPRHVHYVQTPSRFGDVRVPLDRPDMRHAHGFADLSDAELQALAAQKGFAGVANARGGTVTWTHWIDFQPQAPGDADIGRVAPAGAGRIDERAPDSTDVEHWLSISDGDGRFLALEVRRAGRLAQMLVVAGDHFVYARNREHDLPAADSLADLIARTHATREQIVQYLDCELSYGLVHGGAVAWEIESSTLPWREGTALALPRELAVEGGTLVPRAPVAGETWTVTANTLAPADLAVLLRTDDGR
jgi:hypothetical protein